MPEPDNDRLEHFFRKAASKPDVTFNEEDWKKLEARLDAEGAGFADAKKTGSKITSAVVVGTVLLFSSLLWVDSGYDIVPSGDENSSEHVEANIAANDAETETRPEVGIIQGNDVNDVNKNIQAEEISGPEKAGVSVQDKIFESQKRPEASGATDRVSDNEQTKTVEQNKRYETAG